jgi:VPDSG-CTERM motif
MGSSQVTGEKGIMYFISKDSKLGIGLAQAVGDMKLTMKTHNIVPSKKLALLSAAVCAVMFAFAQNASATPHPLPPAISLTFGDGNDLGQVLFGIPSGDAARTAYVNHLIDMAPGTSDSFSGQTFHRSLANPGTTIDLGDGTLYSYLFAKYDGPNAGSEVWYVGGISGVITIPAFGLAGQNYGLSGWTLFGPGVPGVPDGGATVMLLGTALGALGMARRFFKR